VKRWWLVLALLLSLGVNLGILGAVAAHRWASAPAKATEHAAEKAPERAPRPAPRPAPEKAPEPAPEKPPEKPPEKAPEKTPERPAAPPKPAQPAPAAPLPDLGNGPQRVGRLADRLGLEGEPRRRFIALQQRFFTETVRLRTEQAEIHREIRRALVAADPDSARIDALLEESARVFLDLEKAMVTNVAATRQLLDADQEKEFLLFVARQRPAGPRPGRRQQPQLRDGRGQGELPPRWAPRGGRPRRPRWRERRLPPI
jgi:Spy/CpxP family protein refolding chaperone